jgi:rhomboid family protein
MRGRYPSTSGFSYSFGPGPITPAIKALIIANVVAFVLAFFVGERRLNGLFGLRPEDVLEHLRLWQPFTYMFLHVGFFHILFNMLTLWMFGVELERMWGSRFFTKYYVVAGLGAAATQIVLSFVPGTYGVQLYHAITVGASGAVYGVLLAYAMYFPHRPILLIVFMIPARYCVMIIGAIALMSSMSGPSGVAHTAHLGGLVAGYLFLKGRRFHLASEIQYRLTKWRINRMRRRFDVHSGGRRDDYDRRVH